MTTREVPRREWAIFFDTFSRTHKGWLATVEVLSEEIGAQTQVPQIDVQSLPFTGIGADLKDHERRIAVTLGVNPNASLTHGITSPKTVSIKQNDQGTDDVLEIRATDGTITLLSFHSVTASCAA